MRTLAFSSILCVIFVSSIGCSMFEHLAPHQLWKLNRQPAIGRDDAYFNVPPDPKPEKPLRQCSAF